MTLSTASSLPVAPPFALPPIIKANGAGHCEVCLTQITVWQHLNIRGDSAESVLTSAYNTPPLAIGGVVTAGDGLLIRTRRDEFALLASNVASAIDQLSAKPAETLLTLTDITHGRGMIALVGSRAPDVLPKVCGLDFADAKFPDLHAAQTSLAKVRTLIIRRDVDQTPTYFLVVDRSLTAYVWDVLFDAAQEWGAAVLNPDSLNL